MDIRLKKQLVMMVVILLVAGAVFYYVFCPDVFFVQWLDKITGINAHILIDHPAIRIIRNYLLDFVWAFAFANMVFILTYNDTRLRWLVVFLPIVLGTLLEVLQKLKYISGTFDGIDITVETAGAVLTYIITLLKEGKNNEKD